MTPILNLAKMLVPGSIAFLVVALAIALLPVLVRRRWWRWSLGLVIAFGGAYLALSLPWTATRIARPLYLYDQLAHVEDARGASAIVLLDGDHSTLRVIEAARVYRLLKPQWVVVSTGRQGFMDALTTRGVPEQRVLHEAGSYNTRLQLNGVRAILDEYQIKRVVVVASPIHMPRVMAGCAALGIDAIPSATEPPYATLFRRVGPFTPRREALVLSYESLYEYLAQMLYRQRGWKM